VRIGTAVRRSTVGIAVVAALLLGLGYRYEAPRGNTGQWLADASLVPQTAVVAGRQVRFVDTGRGPTVVLLHGFASSIYTWKDVLPALRPGHRVVALDLPPFGGSEAPADLSFVEYVPVVVGLLDRLGIERAALVGNSMGGAVAVLVAAENPSRVSGLVLIDASAYGMGRAENRPWPIRVAGSPAVAAVLDHLPIRRLLVRQALLQVFHDDSLVTPDRLEEYVQPVLRPKVPAAIRALLASRSVDPDLVEKSLARVAAPALVLWGRDDAWLPVAHAERLAKDLHGARFVVFDDCGHMPQEERPAQVAPLVREFVDGLEAVNP
jgi:pimeloyl-ACP methyl ester carboxylesterase